MRVADGQEIATDPNASGLVLQEVLDQNFLQDPGSGYGAGDIYVRASLFSHTAIDSSHNEHRRHHEDS